MNRAQALEAAAALVAHHMPDLPALIDLLNCAGQARIADQLRTHCRGRPARVGGAPKPDIEMWRRGRL
jgi:hypothetical protein